MHQEELTNSIKNLFGNFTESEYLNYFTSKFPRLLIYCYNTVEEHAIDLFEEYFWQQPVQQPVQAPASGKVIPGCGMEGFTLLIKCGDVTIIPETKVKTIFLKIYDISHLFVFENKSFTNFLQRCSSNITQLMFIHGSLKFDSLNKILQKLPNLKKIHFIDVKYETQRTNSSIEQKSCQKLEELEIVGELAQAFQECHTIKQLTVEYPPLTLQKLLEKYSKIEELTVTLNHYYHHYIYNSNKSSLAIHQLKVLKIYIDTIKEDKMRENFFAFINTQKKLKNFSVTTLINAQISQSFCKQLVACIFNMKSLTFLDINCREMVEEVRKFIESCPTKNTGLEEFSFPLESIKLELVFGHFVSLRKLKILCYNSTDLNSYSEMYKTLNKSKLESVKLLLFGESFQYLTLLRLGSLQVLHVTLRKDEFKAYQLTQDNVFDILQELLLKHPNITDLAIMFDYESRILNLIQMIMIVLTKLEKLVFLNHASKIKEEDIRKIVSLEKLKSWTINAYESEPFYKVFN